ncbi:hypothetical protein PP175_23930 [Aneurinibacillus sp. Ricciae_BoGa-3]|uniref:hypothetical protein n=1 Tax=Aneurinibacillus sp. Ricciae_BoGa-3 TaxID=3022697 RepID=UPI0023426726|nr:hypothetical protein [Aneurinibacillus sp. Ricciae_BoGa-3]WCK54299.1 hypothetical protein PP175_23930 [Aneurinibacillus sp. Ricciae_BoGa-3]
MTIKASNATLSLGDNTAVNNITVDSTATGSQITATASARVTGNVVLNAPVTIGGNSSAFNSANVTVNASQVTVNVPLNNVKFNNNNTTIAGTSAQQVIDNADRSGYTPTRTSSNPPSATSITVNNTTSVDTVVVTGSSTGDTIKVYATATDQTPIGTGTAGSNGTANVVLTGLLANSGELYVTRTEAGKTESARTAVTYGQVTTAPAAPTSAALTTGTNAGTTKLTGVNNTMEYTVNSGSYQPIISTSADNITVSSGDVISVRVTANGATPASNAQQLTVALANITPAAAPTTGTLTQGTTSGTTQLTGVDNTMEYVVNTGSYLPITGTTVDNIQVTSTDTIYVRIAATAQKPASNAQVIPVQQAYIKPFATPAAPTNGALTTGTNAGTTKLTGVDNTMEYTVNSGSYLPITGTSVDSIQVSSGDVISVRVAANGATPASNAEQLTVALANITPAAAPTATLTQGTTSGTTQLTGVDNTMEYVVNTGSYLPITGTTVDNIQVTSTDTIYVRIAATAQKPASNAQAIPVQQAYIKP